MNLFTVTIETTGAAFVSEEWAEDQADQPALDGPSAAGEVARILRKLADRVENGSAALGKPDSGAVLDVNGNSCGRWEFS